MTPIERVSIKSQALAVLGLNNTTASASDIKSAYRARVKEKHPDRCDGESAAFLQISDAYAYLLGSVDDFDPTQPTTNSAADDTQESARPVSRTPRPSMDFTPKPRTRSQTMSRPVSRPALQATKLELSDGVRDACKALLDGHEGLVPTHQERSGRTLTYDVPVRLLSNVNKIALPTADLADMRHIRPAVLVIHATDIKDGAYDVPTDVVEAQFPGARRVIIRFFADF